MVDVTQNGVDAGQTTAENATAQAGTMFAAAGQQARDAMARGMAYVEEMNAFARGNVEAMIESSKIAAKGAETFARDAADSARSHVERANDTARRLAAVTSPTELLQLQTEAARGAMDAVAQEGARFAEQYLKLLGAVVQPIQNRMTLAAEKMKVAA